MHVKSQSFLLANLDQILTNYNTSHSRISHPAVLVAGQLVYQKDIYQYTQTLLSVTYFLMPAPSSQNLKLNISVSSGEDK